MVLWLCSAGGRSSLVPVQPENDALAANASLESNYAFFAATLRLGALIPRYRREVQGVGTCW